MTHHTEGTWRGLASSGAPETEVGYEALIIELQRKEIYLSLGMLGSLGHAYHPPDGLPNKHRRVRLRARTGLGTSRTGS